MSERTIKENLDTVLDNINVACRVSKRDASDVTLIAVTKTKPVEMLLEAYDHGIRDFGENKVQELVDKYDKVPKDARFHMIGHLQKNKVKYLISKTVLIHSVDSFELAKVIEKESAKQNTVTDILIEVNVAKEETKFGIRSEELKDLYDQIKELKHIRARGLMTIAPYVDDPEENRQYFVELRNLLIDMRDENIDNNSMDILSMGMTNDYMVAVEEGATYVRVGTGIFGERNRP